ncbi:RIP metalloprotease RseP [Treponema primitia ZAS-2]|uniref:RIP metalloprotease RseP n=1 Tax=Treponema primitia (strain ATCC BAA-887 / DSM 12427 / ZAS-2) TaxID=545694 RepID=F5YR59_TREPZ|nr:site-2 protease family protein [Treponema primitia]AEF86562.1 RIP metalloprotease RseP [Treponema primitia ZAS-2]
MLVVKILLGLFGLGIVVFVHELGHFLAARLVGIDVEAFSIGWGKALFKKKVGAVEYRVSMFPIGGYCKMRGEHEFQEAYENQAKSVAPVPGTFYGATPLRRIVVAFAGPFFNILFAILVLSVIWGIGFEVTTLDNRIVLVSDINPGESYPADQGGLKTGDRIISINGKATANYHDIQEQIATNPEKNLPIQVERAGRTLDFTVRPSLDKSSGAGKIGIYFWSDPIISSVAEGSPGEIAGLRSGDRITRINGEDFPYSVAFFRILKDQPPVLAIDYERDGRSMQTDAVLSYTNGSADLGVSYAAIQFHTTRFSPLGALIKGARETWKTFTLSVKSFGLLFRGIDLTQAVSGPVRITYMVGDVAAEGFGQSIGAGFSSMANFLALISIALCIMNLLPLPVLDGGQIVLFIVEIIKRKPLHPRIINAFQTVGVVLVFGLMLFAVFGDILFLTRR